jgi:hypothetical protein
MPMRIVLVHDDRAFLDLLTAALKEAGYEVVSFETSFFTMPPPQSSDMLEITISRATGKYHGVRLRVTGLPAGQPYAGSLGQFLAEPVTVVDVFEAVRRFIA